MGTVVCLPAGPDITTQCNQCLDCLRRPFENQGKKSHITSNIRYIFIVNNVIIIIFYERYSRSITTRSYSIQ